MSDSTAVVGDRAGYKMFSRALRELAHVRERFGVDGVVRAFLAEPAWIRSLPSELPGDIAFLRALLANLEYHSPSVIAPVCPSPHSPCRLRQSRGA